MQCTMQYVQWKLSNTTEITDIILLMILCMVQLL